MDNTKIDKINEVITNYFTKNKDTEWIPIKELMVDLVEAGVFIKDTKKGLPLRKLLRDLDKKEQLDLIPQIHAERKEESTYWYFVQEGKVFAPKATTYRVAAEPKFVKEEGDEYYIVGLCNNFLEQKASHQHIFEDLLGDLHKNGKTRTPLPIDAYYEELKLAIEFSEKNYVENDVFDKPNKKTISGGNRAAQRERYTRIKKSFLIKEEIKLIEIEYNKFNLDSRLRMIRNFEKDTEIIKKALKGAI